ncbi:MAG: PHB depolymerase family esterase [Deltaproteobacteria bacterium]
MKTKSLVLIFSLTTACGAEYSFDTAVTGLGAGTYAELTGFGSNPGGLKAFEYVPPSPPNNAPLMLALHACSQTASEYRKAGWEELADELGFYVLYPEQQTGNNALRCFNWAGEYGDPTNLMRGEGENLSIKQMVDTMLASYSIDPARVYLSGHSGGAAQVNLMLAVYPDVFAGGASIAGIPYNCTTTFTEVSTCLNPGIDRTASEWGDRARAGFTGYTGPWPKVSVWHGTSDSTVRPRTAEETVEQWTNVHGIDTTPDMTETVDGATHEVHIANGQEVVEYFEIPGMGHGTPVVPAEGCGQAGAFFLDAGICSARRIAESFGLDGGGMMMGDRTPPTVNVTAPANGAMVSSVATITVEATDDTGVTRVEILINGNLETTLNSAPYMYSWSLVGLANGAYTIEAIAYDAAGNNASDADTTVTVTGGVNDTTAPTITLLTPANNAEVSGMVSLTANATDDFGVARVDYEVDGAPAGTAMTAPYEVQWNAGSVAEGAHTILARATDAAGNTGESSVTVTVVAGSTGDTTPPTVSITDPADGATIGGVYTIVANATDDVAMNSVLLFLDDDLVATDYNAPYEFLVDLNTYAEGPHMMTARAFDAAGNLGNVTIGVTIQHMEEPEPSEPVLLGKKRWGCTSMPGGAESATWLVLIGAGALLRRRRWMALVAACLLAACSGEDLYGSGQTSTGAYSTGSKLNAYLDGKTLMMTGMQIPSHPNGYDENINFGQATQCYQSVMMTPSAGRVTVVSQLGTLMNADEVGDAGSCDHTRLSSELTFVSTAFIINNVRGNGECFDFTVTYPGFAQEGRGTIAEDGSEMTLELFFKDQAVGHRCADGDVGDATVTLSQNPFMGNALQVYSIQ